MPLMSGKSKKVRSKNIKEMMDSETFGEDKSEKKRQQMAVAAAYNKSGESKKKETDDERQSRIVKELDDEDNEGSEMVPQTSQLDTNAMPEGDSELEEAEEAVGADLDDDNEEGEDEEHQEKVKGGLFRGKAPKILVAIMKKKASK